MIVGIGTDLAETTRIQQATGRFGERFLRRIYTQAEIAYCTGKGRNAAESLAARFAAKEAGAKALGTGIAAGIGWHELEVAHLSGGQPVLLLHGRAAERAAALRVSAIHLSLSHSRNQAVAIVILESRGRQ